MMNKVHFHDFFLFLKDLFIYLGENESGGSGRWRERENHKQPDEELNPTTLRSWAEPKSRVRCSADWATQTLLFWRFLDPEIDQGSLTKSPVTMYVECKFPQSQQKKHFLPKHCLDKHEILSVNYSHHISDIWQIEFIYHHRNKKKIFSS